MRDLESLSRLVCQVAREAGAYIRKERANFSVDKVERKHAHDYVSYVDKGSELLIVKSLREILPGAGFITEEGTTKTLPQPLPEREGSSNSQDGKDAEEHFTPLPHKDGAGEGLLWVVDPLDGTTNFIHGYAPYAVSIALIQDKDILLGVVYDVCADECYYAWKGGGAYLEVGGERSDVRGERSDVRGEKSEVRVERLAVGTSAINDALLCMQLPYNSDAYKPVIKHLIDRFYGNVGSIRMIGSAAMALCYVAAGRLDGYVERYIGRWDYMAGALIVQEAGGTVTDYNGSVDFTRGDSVVASNGVVHQPLLEAVAVAVTATI
jgi:myo-inositol-1(or 4)-monophosphatase